MHLAVAPISAYLRFVASLIKALGARSLLSFDDSIGCLSICCFSFGREQPGGCSISFGDIAGIAHHQRGG